MPTTPIHVVVDKASSALPHWTNWVPVAAPIVTALIAATAVVIASKALGASRRSADNSAESVKRADAALRGSTMPVLTLTSFRPKTTVLNAGPGVALDVVLVMGSASDADASDWGWLRTDLPVPVVAAGKSHDLQTIQWGNALQGGYVAIILWCRDVSGETHWTYRPGSISAVDGTTTIGVGPLPDEAARVVAMCDASRPAPESGDAKP